MPTRAPASENLFDEFSARLDAAGGRAIEVASIEEIASTIGDVGGPVYVSGIATAAFPGLDASLLNAGVEILTADNPAGVRDAPVGITAARLAIAETGSVLLVEPDLADRSVSLMTQRLIVLCPRSALVASLDEAAPVLREVSAPGPSYATFVTGPSRTADIERELAVGVQGPGMLEVVFVADIPSTP
jgi:L-lactate dehydrogenase complex protein LldG